MLKQKSLLILIAISIVLVVFVAGLLIGTSSKKNIGEVSNCKEIDIFGKVTNIQKIDDGIIMLVEDDYGISKYDKAYITVNKSTFIIKTVYSRTFTPEEIMVGDSVKVEFIGPVAESYPVQAKAGFVWITESEVP